MSTTTSPPPSPQGDGQGPDDAKAPVAAAPPPLSPNQVRGMSVGVPGERSRDFKNSSLRLMSLLRRDRLGVGVPILLAVVGVALTVAGPKILGNATNVVVDGFLSPEGIDFPRLHRVLGLALVLFVASGALTYGSGWLLAGVVQRTMFRLRRDVEAKLNRLPLSYIDRQQRGDLLSRVSNDIDNIAQSLQQTLNQLLTQGLQLIGVLGVMIWISPVLALVAIVSVPLSFFIIKGIGKRSKARFIAQWTHTGVLNAQVEEAFTGHAIVKAFGRQREVEARFREENERLYGASFAAQFISGVIQPAMMFLGNLNYVIIAVLGGMRIVSGSLTIGDLQAFLQYTRQFSMPLTAMASMFNVLQSGVASAERVFELLDAQEQSPDDDAEPLAGVPRGRVAFENVSFSYDKDSPLITDLSLVAEPGQTIAIVGPNGAGKTTLVNLIMRFYELDAGRITIDGRDLHHLAANELRQYFGVVPQETFLFSGTVYENLIAANPNATFEDVTQACRIAGIHGFIDRLPKGYHAEIGEHGTGLSGGQKQRLAIARALLKRPRVLIFDEATSNLDERTAEQFAQTINGLKGKVTMLFIAHQLPKALQVDEVATLGGRDASA